VKLIIDGDKDMLKIFNSMGISTTHIKELKTMLKGAPMIKEEGIYGFEPSFIKGNSKLLNLYSKPSMINLSRSDFARYECATLKPSDSAALPFKICEFFVTVAMIRCSDD
jgi:hypothetical protein